MRGRCGRPSNKGVTILSHPVHFHFTNSVAVISFSVCFINIPAPIDKQDYPSWRPFQQLFSNIPGPYSHHKSRLTYLGSSMPVVFNDNEPPVYFHSTSAAGPLLPGFITAGER